MPRSLRIARLAEGRALTARFLRGDFVRHGLIVFASTMFVNVFNYAFHFAISRRLGVVDYGALYSLFAALTLLGMPTTVFTMIVVRYAAEFRAVGDAGKLAALSRWVVMRTGALALAVFIVALLLAQPIAGYLRIADPRAVPATGLVLGLSIVLPGLRGILQGVEDFGRWSISSALEGGGKALFGIGLVYLGFGVVGALAGYAIALTLAIAYTAVTVRRRHFTGETEPLRIDVPRLLQTTAGVGVATLALSAMGSADLLLVKHFFPPHEAGLYSAVSLVGKVLLFVVGFVPTVVLPKATARVAEGRSPLSILVQAGVIVALLCGSGLAVLGVAPALVVRAMSGSAFTAAAPLVLAYGVAMALLGATTAVVNYRVGIHRFDFVVPLVAVAAGEIVAITFLHASLIEVIRVLIVGHGLGLGVSLFRIGAVRVRAIAVPAREVA